MVQPDRQLSPLRIEIIRKKINNEEYLDEAIERIAQVLSEEMLTIPEGGNDNGQQRKGRK